MLWNYVGCDIHLVPKEFLEKTDNLSREEFVQLLQSAPITEGEAEAVDTKSLVRVLMAKNIFPLKIRPCTTIDARINRLKALTNKTVNNNFTHTPMVLPVPAAKSKIKIILLIAAIVIIVGALVKFLF